MYWWKSKSEMVISFTIKTFAVFLLFKNEFNEASRITHEMNIILIESIYWLQICAFDLRVVKTFSNAANY